jgi:hypothetical protein
MDSAEPVRLLESLADKLDEATNPATRAKRVEEAKAIIQRYQATLPASQLLLHSIPT